MDAQFPLHKMDESPSFSGKLWTNTIYLSAWSSFSRFSSSSSWLQDIKFSAYRDAPKSWKEIIRDEAEIGRLNHTSKMGWYSSCSCLSQKLNNDVRLPGEKVLVLVPKSCLENTLSKMPSKTQNKKKEQYKSSLYQKSGMRWSLAMVSGNYFCLLSISQSFSDMLGLNLLYSCEISDSTSELQSPIIGSRWEIKSLHCFLENFILRLVTISRNYQYLHYSFLHCRFFHFHVNEQSWSSRAPMTFLGIQRTRGRYSFGRYIIDIDSWYIDKISIRSKVDQKVSSDIDRSEIADMYIFVGSPINPHGQGFIAPTSINLAG